MTTAIAVTTAAGIITNITPPAADINSNTADITEIKSHTCEKSLK